MSLNQILYIKIHVKAVYYTKVYVYVIYICKYTFFILDWQSAINYLKSFKLHGNT